MSNRQHRMTLGELIPSVLVYALGWAGATVIMAFALHVVRTAAVPSATPFLLVFVAGSLTVGVTAGFSAYRCESDRAAAEGFGWGVGFAAAVLVFWFWIPIVHFAATFAPAPASTNTVRIARETDSGDMANPYPRYRGEGTYIHLSEVQVRLLVAICVFGSIGGFASRLPRSARRRHELGNSALSALIWVLSVLIGGACLFVGFYLFVGFLAEALRPATGLGVALGAALAGLVAGAVTAVIAMPVQQRLVDS
jgi:hypothetical protein